MNFKIYMRTFILLAFSSLIITSCNKENDNNILDKEGYIEIGNFLLTNKGLTVKDPENINLKDFTYFKFEYDNGESLDLGMNYDGFNYKCPTCPQEEIGPVAQQFCIVNICVTLTGNHAYQLTLPTNGTIRIINGIIEFNGEVVGTLDEDDTFCLPVPIPVGSQATVDIDYFGFNNSSLLITANWSSNESNRCRVVSSQNALETQVTLSCAAPC